PLDRAAFDDRRFDAAALRLLHEIGIGDRVLRRLPRVELLDHGQHDESDDEPDSDVLQQIVQATLLAVRRLPRAAPAIRRQVHSTKPPAADALVPRANWLHYP